MLVPDAHNEEVELRFIISKLKASIQQRNKDASGMREDIESSCSRIAKSTEAVTALVSDRDDFLEYMEDNSLPSVPKNVQSNYSTRIDDLRNQLLQMKADSNAAKEQVDDLVSGSEIAKQEREKAARNVEEMERTYGEALTRRDEEIDSLKQQLSDATAKITTDIAEKARLVEKVSSTLVCVSKFKRTAESQAMKVKALESENARLRSEIARLNNNSNNP